MKLLAFCLLILACQENPSPEVSSDQAQAKTAVSENKKTALKELEPITLEQALEDSDGYPKARIIIAASSKDSSEELNLLGKGMSVRKTAEAKMFQKSKYKIDEAQVGVVNLKREGLAEKFDEDKGLLTDWSKMHPGVLDGVEVETRTWANAGEVQDGISKELDGAAEGEEFKNLMRKGRFTGYEGQAQKMGKARYEATKLGDTEGDPTVRAGQINLIVFFPADINLTRADIEKDITSKYAGITRMSGEEGNYRPEQNLALALEVRPLKKKASISSAASEGSEGPKELVGFQLRVRPNLDWNGLALTE